MLLLALTLLPVIVCQCTQYHLKETFQDGFEKNWEQTAGKGYGTITSNHEGGIKFVMESAEEFAMTLKSKVQFTPPTTFTFIVKGASASGTMSDAVIWNLGKGKSEIDLELLGDPGRANQIMCPVWPENHDGTYLWKSGGVATSFGGFSEVPGSASVSLDDFDHREKHTYILRWTEDQVTWTVDNQVYLDMKKGSSTKWIQGPANINIGIWNQLNSKWMGTYAYDPANPPTYAMYSVEAEGCILGNTTSEEPPQPSSHFTSQLAPTSVVETSTRKESTIPQPSDPASSHPVKADAGPEGPSLSAHPESGSWLSSMQA